MFDGPDQNVGLIGAICAVAGAGSTFILGLLSNWRQSRKDSNDSVLTGTSSLIQSQQAFNAQLMDRIRLLEEQMLAMRDSHKADMARLAETMRAECAAELEAVKSIYLAGAQR